MTQLEEKEMILNMYKQFSIYLKTVKSILLPFKKNIDGEYYRGWNDCIKEINNNYNKLIEKTNNWEPGLREDYWCVDCRGEVKLTDNNDLAYDHWNIKSGNCFGTKEEAENYKMRLIAMKPKYLPKKGERYWTVGQHPVSNKWDNDFVDKLNYYPGITFKTEKEAQEWLDTYGKYFEVEG